MDTHISGVIKQISEALYEDPRTKKSVIEVGFSRGIVVLSGMVKNAAAIQAAEEIARAQEGVLSVVNELKIG